MKTEKSDGWRLYCSTILAITGAFAGAWLLTVRWLTRKTRFTSTQQGEPSR